MKVLITGATGLIGKELGDALVQKGHHLIVVSRHSGHSQLGLSYPCDLIEGDLSQAAIADERFKTVDAVVHLMGENVGDGRWTFERRKKILESRTLGTKNLYTSLAGNKKLQVIVAASAVGYYGDRGDEELNEASSQGFRENEDSGTIFLSHVCREWEEAVLIGQKEKFPESRSVILRTGVVLSAKGGALPKMIKPFQLGMGTALGSGKQWMSWIHIQDLVNMYVDGIEKNDLAGIYNAVAPHPATNEEFTSRLAQILKKWQGPNIPEFVLRLAMGEMATLVLASQRVYPQRFLSQGFEFSFSELTLALEDLIRS